MLVYVGKRIDDELSGKFVPGDLKLRRQSEGTRGVVPVLSILRVSFLKLLVLCLKSPPFRH